MIFQAVWMRCLTLLPLICSLIFCSAAYPEEYGPGKGREGRRNPQRQENTAFLTEIPEYSGNVILGRPTATAITLSLLWQGNLTGELVWGVDPLKLPAEGRAVKFEAGVPQRVFIDGLIPDTRYFYAVLDRSTGKRLLPIEQTGSFHTARPSGKPFTFTIQADSHLDGSTLPELYRRTITNALADAPDFHIDLGDTFMTEKHSSRESAAKQYAAQRYYFGLIGHSAPLFLVPGNHDGEALDRKGKTEKDSLALWSHEMRTRYFANPVPDGFYSGNQTRHPLAGMLENYYAWEWGDGLFVVLDPYWTSLPTRGGREPWNMTIGTAQYEWLSRTLKNSKARHKFVFIHQLTGSYHTAGRGGSEAALYQEWGGRNIDGSEGMSVNRPGWDKPIHRLLVESGVTAVFHGHDHFYARQELDGIVYQLVPQPAHRNDRSHQADEYGYKEGGFLPNSGHLKVYVTQENVRIDYVRSLLSDSEQRSVRNGYVSASYTLQRNIR